MRIAPRSQRGSALVTGLVFLVVIIMLGLSASSSSIQQEMAVRNVRDQNVAMEAAEAALRAGETWIRNNGGPPPLAMNPVTGNALVRMPEYCSPTVNNCAEAAATFWSTNGALLGSADQTPTLSLVAEQPRYIIEFMLPSPVPLGSTPNKYYRIVARGVGMNERTYRIVHSIIRF